MLTNGDKAYIPFTIWYCWAVITFLRVQWFMISPPNPPGAIKARWMFASYDMWMGAYIDRANKKAYWFPLPFVGRKYWREVAGTSQKED